MKLKIATVCSEFWLESPEYSLCQLTYYVKIVTLVNNILFVEITENKHNCRKNCIFLLTTGTENPRFDGTVMVRDPEFGDLNP